MYDGSITVKYQTVTLSKYRVKLQEDRKQITQVSHPHRAQHPFRSPQLTLIDVAPDEWRLYWRAPSYQRRPRQKRIEDIVQLPLFDQELQDMVVGADTGHGGARPSARLHLVEQPPSDQDAEE